MSLWEKTVLQIWIAQQWLENSEVRKATVLEQCAEVVPKVNREMSHTRLVCGSSHLQAWTDLSLSCEACFTVKGTVPYRRTILNQGAVVPKGASR